MAKPASLYIRDLEINKDDEHFADGVACVQAYWAFSLDMCPKDCETLRRIIIDGDYEHTVTSRQRPSAHRLYKNKLGTSVGGWVVMQTLYKTLPQDYIDRMTAKGITVPTRDRTERYFELICDHADRIQHEYRGRTPLRSNLPEFETDTDHFPEKSGDPPKRWRRGRRSETASTVAPRTALETVNLHTTDYFVEDTAISRSLAPLASQTTSQPVESREVMPPGAGAVPLAPSAAYRTTAASENNFPNARGQVRNYEEAFGNHNNGVTSDNRGSGTPHTDDLEMDPVAAAHREGWAKGWEEGRAEAIQTFLPLMNAATTSINAAAASVDALWAELLRQRQ
ncbi:hypothetical protein THAR02_10497 [Trichoderma harzianum]|uniref:Uncharacterized protein n=1 Tax=Trichoderma harzianum TaxID=5544 RepID=A0A0F9Z9U0_TRIHA|nr:hypothetical protein THAR02_10497 [Trichoderma harzianum]